MRTKALVLTAAFIAAGAVSSMAQVYSANAVGYVNLSLASGFTIIANPLNGTNNHLNTILPLPDAADGTTIFRFKTDTQRYGEPIVFFGFGIGWLTTDPGGDAFMTLDPGEGVFIQNATGAALNVTFVGEVPQGNLSNPVPAAFSIMASEVPQALPIGAAGQTGTLEFPAAEGDSVFIFNSATQLYKENYTYFDGIGWLSANPDDPGVQGPTIPVATGFFVQKGAAANWTRVFSVN